MVQAQDGIGELGVTGGESAPPESSALGGVPGDEAGVQPGKEVGARKTGAEKIGAHLCEPSALSGEVLVFGEGGLGDVYEFGEGCQVTVADQGGDGGSDDGGTEQAVHEVVFGGGEAFGGGTGQTDHVGIGEVVEDLGEQASPYLEQVMAFVE